MIDCIFCKIVDGVTHAEITHQAEEIIVFKSIQPRAPVHLLIIPKKHVLSIKELTEEDRNLTSSLIYTAKEVAEREHLPGYRLAFNVGRAGGQVINHLHLHLLGGWKDGELTEV
ncbi:MAG: Hit-like protein involved in cell-cycle regulation [Parcubacteria group bacterium Gr01-1014_29]|nr:MAG: Hit-like protein involved in cell-cycle regulation [Parcubacteria group bacterium Gr01-1014_29]